MFILLSLFFIFFFFCYSVSVAQILFISSSGAVIKPITHTREVKFVPGYIYLHIDIYSCYQPLILSSSGHLSLRQRVPPEAALTLQENHAWMTSEVKSA